MATPAAPNEFSGHLRKWILEKCRSSVFFVMATAKSGALKDLDSHMNDAKILPAIKRKAEHTNNRAMTGWVVDEGEDDLKIMTCAHLIDHVFSAKKTISVEDINKLFLVRVVCDHAEVDFVARRRRNRAYSVATVVDIDCANDTLLLEIPKADIALSVSGVGNPTVCLSPHLPIRQGLIPAEQDGCFMISWPADKHLTSVGGWVTHCSRTIKAMPGKNLNGYSMKLLQADIRSEPGCSGSALLNGQGEAIAMLHGGDVQHSYFVSMEDLSRFLRRNEVPWRA